MTSVQSDIDARTIGRLSGLMFVAASSVALLDLFVLQRAYPDPTRVAAVSGTGIFVGFALIRFGVASGLPTLLVAMSGAVLIALGMAGAPPALAPFGLVYLTWLAIYSGFFQSPRLAALASAWCFACFLAWSLSTPDRPHLSDALVALNGIGIGAALTSYLAHERRASHASLDDAGRDAERLSLRDPLTGVANRRAFDLEAEERAVAGRLGGLLMIDVDHLETVNDEHTHLIGDEVLEAVARRISQVVRRQDLVARPGGDEFAVLLEGPTNMKGLRHVADIVRGATSGRPIQTSSGFVMVTISLGGALPSGELTPLEAIEEMTERADRALHAAKAAGRDRAILDGETRTEHPRRRRSA